MTISVDIAEMLSASSLTSN